MEKTIEIPEGYKARIEGSKVILEPKESEDERIRKVQLNYWRSVGGKEWHGVPVQEVIAWLEKQGEQNLANSEKICKDEQHLNYIKDIRKSLKHLEDYPESVSLTASDWVSIRAAHRLLGEYAELFEKQGEQKPNFCHHEVDFSGCSEEYRKAYYDGWNNCNQQHKQLEAEQNPAWSEEDEEMLRRCISATFDHGYLKECDWLKSFKERYTWKPSDEQIDAIEYFVRSLGESGYMSPYDYSTKLVYSLLSDLKKLKS